MKHGLVLVALVLALPGLAGSTDQDEGFGNAGARSGYADAILPLPGGDTLLGSRDFYGVHLSRIDSSGAYKGTIRREKALACPPNVRCWMDLALDAQQRIIVAGGSKVVRLLVSGERDTSFGVGGVVTVPGGHIEEVAVGPSGAVVVAGSRRLARIRADGRLDEEFGTGGRVQLPAGERVGSSLVVQQDEKIILGGAGAPVRYTQRGTLDFEYGVRGSAVTGGVEVPAIALQPDGKLVGGSLTVIRLTETGRRDPSFGLNGVAQSWPSTGRAHFVRHVLVLPDGGVVVAGDTYYSETFGSFVHRIEPDGSSRRAPVDRGDATTDGCQGGSFVDAAVQADGKVLISAGSCSGGFIARFQPDLTLDAGGTPLSLARVGSGDVRLRQRGTTWSGTVTLSVGRAATITAVVRSRPRSEPLVLLAGSSVGATALRKPARRIETEATARRVAIRVVLASTAIAKGATVLLDVRAEDARTRVAHQRVRLVAR